MAWADRIESTGDLYYLVGRSVPRGRGMAMRPEWEAPGEVFGTGASQAGFYRRELLLKVGLFPETYSRLITTTWTWHFTCAGPGIAACTPQRPHLPPDAQQPRPHECPPHSPGGTERGASFLGQPAGAFASACRRMPHLLLIAWSALVKLVLRKQAGAYWRGKLATLAEWRDLRRWRGGASAIKAPARFSPPLPSCRWLSSQACADRERGPGNLRPRRGEAHMNKPCRFVVILGMVGAELDFVL